nr:envelope protein 2 variant 382 [Hepacivirus hominis]MOZ58433.1 envelope protein 2 variant 638 [Hepacivirus hominis]
TTHISGGTAARQAKGLAAFFQLGAQQK